MLLFISFQRLKLYYDQGETKRYNGKRRMNDLKTFVDKFAGTSEVYYLLTFNLWIIPLDFLTSFPSVNFSRFYWHNSPQLTCSQHQWLYSSVGRALHRYHEVTGSNPVEVLIFFSGFFTQLHVNCVHCDDHFFIFITLIDLTPRPHYGGIMAEQLEHWTCNLEATSSSPVLTASWICSW